jgi:hypothetical protein
VTATDTPHTDPQAARQARRTALRNLITRVGRGRAGADMATLIAGHVDAEQADGDEAHTRLADYENRITWETTCGEHARLLDSCRAADERAEKAEQRAAAAEAGRVAADNVIRAVCDVFGGPHKDPVVEARQTLARADQDDAAIARVRALAHRAIADWSDIDGGTVLDALDGTGDAEPAPPRDSVKRAGYPFPMPDGAAEAYGAALPLTRHGDDEPAALDGAALWAAIRDHAARDHQFWNDLTRNHNRLHGHGVTR